VGDAEFLLGERNALFQQFGRPGEAAGPAEGAGQQGGAAKCLRVDAAEFGL
jgi:hypothetical protein